MPSIKIKKGGSYIDPVGVFAKKSGVYFPVAGLYAKASGGYVNAGDTLASQVGALFSAGGGLYYLSGFSNLFQDVAGTTPVTALGQTVRRINDRSPNAVNLVNPTGWVLAQDEKARPYLALDGASCFTAAIAWTGTAVTLGAAFSPTALTLQEYPISLGNTANITAFAGIRKQLTTGIYQAVAGGGFGSTLATAASSGEANVPHTFVVDFATPLFHRDETIGPVGTGSVSSLAAVNVLGVGAWVRQSTSSYLTGRWYGAFALPRTLTGQEISLVKQFFRGLYGITGVSSALGDSHTFTTAYGLTANDFYPRRLSVALGGNVAAMNYGVGGNTTANMVARLATVTAGEVPKFAVIYGGANDPAGNTTVQASPAPTTTSFSVASAFGAQFGAGAAITVNGADATILSVSADVITLTAPLGFTPVAGQAVTINTGKNLVKMAQAFQVVGCSRILVPGLHYYNYASGGDTPEVERPSSATYRSIALAAANEAGAAYVDFYGYMRSLILAGRVAQGDDLAWHVAVGNPHLNVAGEQALADALLASMRERGWA